MVNAKKVLFVGNLDFIKIKKSKLNLFDGLGNMDKESKSMQQ